MKKYTTTKWMWLLLFFLGSWLQGTSQVTTWELNWDRANADDQLSSTIEISSPGNSYDGFIVSTGNGNNVVGNNSNTDGYLSLINPSTGVAVWTNAYGWNTGELISSVIQADDTTLIAFGHANWASTALYGDRDFWFLKVHLNNGSVIQSCTFNSANSYAYGFKIINSVVTHNGLPTFLITGRQTAATETINNAHGVYVARLDWNGNVIWENQSRFGASNSQSNDIMEIPNATNLDSSRIFIVGNRGGEGGDGLIIEYTAMGQTVNARTYTKPDIFESVNYRVVNQNIQFYVGGVTAFPSGTSTLTILNNNLDIVNSFEYPLTNAGTFHRLAFLNDDRIEDEFLALFVGVGGRSTHVARMDLNGNVSSVRHYTDANMFGIIELDNGDHFLTGRRFHNNQWDILINRVDSQLTTTCNNVGTISRTLLASTATNLIDTATVNTIVPKDTLMPMIGIPLFNVYSSCCDDFVVATSQDTTICAGQTVSLMASATGNLGAVEYNWNTGETTASVAVSPTTTTSYIVTVTDTLTQCSRTDTILVTVQELTITISGDSAVCEGQSTTLTADQIGYTSYLWNTGETSTSIEVTPSTTTTYTLTVTDANGCTNTTSHVVIVNALPNAGILGDLTVCSGDLVSITGTGGVTYDWDLLDGDSGNTILSSVTGNPLGFTHPTGLHSYDNINGKSFYRYLLRVTDVNGCINSQVFRVQGSNLEVELQGDSIFCEGDAIDFTAIATGGQRTNTIPYQFSWNGNTPVDGAVVFTTPREEESFFSLPSTPGTGLVHVKVTDDYGCEAETNLNYTVSPTPSLTLTASAGSPICVGKTMTLTAIYDEQAVSSITWLPNIGTGSTVNVPTDFIGTTTYTVTIVDTNGCSNTTSIDVEVENCCWTSLSTDYIRLDPNYSDTRISDYNITQAGHIFYLQSDYQRLPERLYLATNVTLVIESTNSMTIADLTNSDVVFGEGAGIVVRDAKMMANNAVFRPCNDNETWDGIRIESTSNGYMTTVNVLESSFINATVGLWYQNAADGSIADNTFSNCQFGIIVTQNTLPGAMTNNIFKVDNAATDLTYSLHHNINEVNGGDGKLLSQTNFVTMNARYFGYNLPFYDGNDITDFAGIEILNSSTGDAILDKVIISQNQFVNAMHLADSNAAQFNGILLSNTKGLNISNNTFTNNNKSIVADNPQDISIENNTIEVTRRSQVDKFTYQILGVGEGLTSSSSLMIHNNTILNSADPADLSAYISNNSSGSTLVKGSGAIYLANIATTTGVHVTDNTIKGFEVGIYSTGASSSNHARITGNDIKAHIYGIYVDEAATFGMGTLVGCNRIDMDLDSDNTHSVRPVGIVGNKVNENLKVYSNCISNTANAIWYRNLIDKTGGNINLMPSTYNNYLNNYTDAGLLVEEYKGSVTFGSTNTSSIYGTPNQIGRNEFVSNFNGFDINYTGSSLLISNNNYYSGYLASVTGNVVVAGNPLKSYASCHGDEAQDLMPDEMNNMDILVYACDDEDLFTTYNTILQRVSNGNIVLSNDYQTVLVGLMNQNTDVVTNTLMTTLQTLSNENDATELYSAILNLDLPTSDKQWLSVAYFQKVNAPQQALATLNVIQTNDEATADRIVIETARLNRQIGGTTTITNTTDIESLKVIANREGSYMHTARGLLNESIGGFGFRYRTLPLPSAKSNQNQTPNIVTELSNPIEIYPNPTSEQLFVNILEIGETPWTIATIVDLHGRVIATQQVTTDKLRFDVTNMPQGIYVLLLRTENGVQTAQKFVKQ